MVFCPECGYNNDSSNKFCKKCVTFLNPGKSNTIETKNIPGNKNQKHPNDYWNGLSDTAKLLHIMVSCCIGLIIVAVVTGFVILDSNILSGL